MIIINVMLNSLVFSRELRTIEKMQSIFQNFGKSQKNGFS